MTHGSGDELVLEAVIVAQESDGIAIDAKDDGIDEGEGSERTGHATVQASDLLRPVRVQQTVHRSPVLHTSCSTTWSTTHSLRESLMSSNRLIDYDAK